LGFIDFPHSHLIVFNIMAQSSFNFGGSGLFGILYCIALGIVNLVWAERSTDSCDVPHHSMDLDLKDFLFWLGVVQLILVPTLLACVGFGIFGMTQKGKPGLVAKIAACAIALLVALPAGLFVFAWTIVGAIILFQDGITCIWDGEDSHSIGVLALVNLILTWSSVFLYIGLPVPTARNTDVD
jgi:hypothetical protein